MEDIFIEFTELLETLSDDLIQNIFNKLDKTKIAIALKTIDPKVSEKIFKNLSQNDSKEIKNKMSGVVRIENVEAAQRYIIKKIKNEKQ